MYRKLWYRLHLEAVVRDSAAESKRCDLHEARKWPTFDALRCHPSNLKPWRFDASNTLVDDDNSQKSWTSRPYSSDSEFTQINTWRNDGPIK